MSIEAGSPPEGRVVYRSRVEVEPGPERSKFVFLPAEREPVQMGFHGDLAPRFGLTDGEYTPRASTLDYLVGATAGCMTGVLAAALKARGIPVGDGRLRTEAVGDVELEEGILVLRRIHFLAHLLADEEHRAAAERIAATFERRCPVYLSLRAAIEITAELDFQPISPP